MKSEWKKCKLGDICLINTASYSTSDNYSFINYLDTGSITQNKIEKIQKINLSMEKLPSRAKRKIKYNSIIYSTVRPNQRHYGIIKKHPENFIVSTGFAVIDVDTEKANPDFIYYILIQDEVINSLQAVAEQSVSTYPSIKPSDIEKIDIFLPPMPVQKKIAGILKSLDDKIELNRQISKNLEEQAQAIFKDWFIDHPQSEWQIGKLSEIAEITMGQSPDGSSYNENKMGVVFYQGRAEFGFRFPTQRLFTTQPKRMAKRNDILLSVRAPVGDINVANENCCIGRGLAAIHSKDNHQSFLLYTMYSLKEKLGIYNAQGTVFGCINRDALNDLEIVIPPKDVIDKFEKIASSLDAKIAEKNAESTHLTQIRDTILPKLMCGEIDLSDIKC